MFFRRIALFLVFIILFGCDLREDTSLPSGVSPFELFDDAIYIIGNGLYTTSRDNIYLRISKKESEGFDFVTDSYDFTPSSHTYLIEFVNAIEEIIEVEDFFPLLALPSEQFTYLGLKYPGVYERFYPYPESTSINGFGAYYETGYCYFQLSNNGYYQTVNETESHSSVTVQINPIQANDVNVSLYQAQFILPWNLIPLGIQRVKFEKVESNNLAEYNLNLLDLPVNFNMIQNNPNEERYPILYLPLSPETDMTKLSVKQILPDHRELVFHYTEIIDNSDQFTVYGNCVILFVNNPGRFIIN